MAKSADAFRTIGEVADWLGVPAHVLRFWESKFSQVKPVKRAGGRRYYRPADMQLLGGIRKLLHDDGMTIKGVQKMMRDKGVRHVADLSPPLDADLHEAVAGIALDVSDDSDEPAVGTVLNFQRGQAPQDDAAAAEAAGDDDDSDDAPKPVPEDTAPAPATAGAQAHEEKQKADPAPEADSETTDDPEPVEVVEASTPAPRRDPVESDAIRDEGIAPTPEPATKAARVASVTTPDDPSDTVSAPPSVLSALAGLDSATAAAHRSQLADIASRLTALRAQMDGARKSS